jgi:nickel/cobalt transporter (NicO) family protein
MILSYSTALLLGSLHAFEADHMAAVTSFAVRRPSLRAAIAFGVRWAAGHGGAIVLVGAGLILLGLHLPDAATDWLERFVGVVMIGLGIWTFRGATRLHTHRHAHGDGVVHQHVHAHGPGKAAHAGHAHGGAHEHGHAATAVGLVHGLAGSGSAVALIPVVGFDSPGPAILYLVSFAVGTIAAMALYGLLAGFVVGRTAANSTRLARLLARATGVFTVIVGVVWLLA